MSDQVYGLEALRKLREQQAGTTAPGTQISLLAQISPDVPMDDSTITAWNGERFMDYDKWRAIRPVATEDAPEPGPRKADVKAARAKASEQEGLWEEDEHS